MACKKGNFFVILGINTLIVFIVFMLLDWVLNGLVFKGPNPYITSVNDYLWKSLFTLVLSAGYAHLYNKASRIWRPVPKYVFTPEFNAAGFQSEGLIFGEAFVYKEALRNMPETDNCKATWPKIANGLIFCGLTCLVIFSAIALLDVMISSIYIYFLHGIRGALPPPELHEAGVMTAEAAAATLALEWKGRTEDDPRGGGG